MKKFTCGHCGGRIAIPPRMMGQLVVCPDCGKPTHPLATEILAAAKDKPPERSLSAEPIERRCENCGRTIGRLEPLQVWDNHLVCAECHPRLARAAPSAKTREMTLPAAAPIAAASPSAPTPVAERPGPPEKKPRGKKAKELTYTPATPPEAAANAASAPIAPVNPDSADGSAVFLPDPDVVPASSTAKTIVIDSARPIPVSVSRWTDSAASTANAANTTKPFVFKHRLVMLLAIVFVAGAAMYGALTLLRDLMGILTLIAFGLMAVAAGSVLIKLGLAYVRRRWAAWRAGRGAKNGETGTELTLRR